MEYFTVDGLTKEIAHGIESWPKAITKELIDNSLDACEAIPVTPLIEVTIDDNKISVADNAGEGLPEATLQGSQNYEQTVSNKALYVSPLRGRQGNALKTVWAAPYVYNGNSGRIQIVTPSYARELNVSLNKLAQEPVIISAPLDRPFVKTGTIVTIEWDRVSLLSEDAEMPNFYKSLVDLLQGYALFNPHAGFKLSCNGATTVVGEPVVSGWEKWTPAKQTSPHWYTVEPLARLIGAKVYSSHGQQTVRDFVSEFAGLKGTGKQQEVVTRAGLSKQRLDDLVCENKTELDNAVVGRLLKEMQHASKPIKAAKMGVLGKDVLARRLIEIEGVADEVRYFKELTEGPEPLVTEIAVGTRKTKETNPQEAFSDDDEAYYPSDGRRLRCGLNFTPALRTPFKIIPRVFQEMFSEARDPVCIAIHSTSPHIEFEDRGKSMLSGEDVDD
jgi:DNA topoisomerase VI subunit B